MQRVPTEQSIFVVNTEATETEELYVSAATVLYKDKFNSQTFVQCAMALQASVAVV